MADLEFIEKIAMQIKENRKKLSDLEESLAEINMKLHEIPLKRSTESTFAKMIGVGYDDNIEDLKKTKEKLESQIDELKTNVSSAMNSFISELSSQDLVVPLEPKPKLQDGKTIYNYRNGKQFNNVFAILSEILGLSAPLVVKDVMLSPSEITIASKEEFEAKQKFINAMSEIQNTLLIKKKQ